MDLTAPLGFTETQRVSPQFLHSLRSSPRVVVSVASGAGPPAIRILATCWEHRSQQWNETCQIGMFLTPYSHYESMGH